MMQSIGGVMVLAMIRKAIEEKEKEEARAKAEERAKEVATKEGGTGE